MTATATPPPEPRSALDRMLERAPAPLQPHLRESTTRLIAVRTIQQGQQALQDEYEHVLRLVLPAVIERPWLRSPAAAGAWTAGFAALAAAAIEADEILSLVSVGTMTAPGTSVVVAVGLVSAVVESYATASVRVNQLQARGVAVDAEQLAADVRLAVLGGLFGTAGRVAIGRRLLRGSTARLPTRWVVAAVPFLGMAYAGYDSARSVRRVLRLPIPPPPAPETSRD